MCEKQAVKQILADRIKAAMEKDRLTKAVNQLSAGVSSIVSII